MTKGTSYGQDSDAAAKSNESLESIEPERLSEALTEFGQDAPPSRQEKFASVLDTFQYTFQSAWRPLFVLAVLFLLWEIEADQGWIASYLVPAPSHVWHSLVSSKGYLWKNAIITLNETVVGFLIATFVGIVAAAAIVSSKATEKTLYPLLIFAQVIPKVAIAPLFVVWLGFGSSPKILVAVLVAFFPVVVSTVSGLRSVNPDLLSLAAVMGGSPRKTFWKIRFPGALPQIFSGLKVAATLSVVGAVVGEFVGANSGIGYVLLTANGNLDTSILYAGLFILSLIGAIVFLAVSLLEHIFVPWQPSRRVNPGISA